jgi:hypothetical protein
MCSKFTRKYLRLVGLASWRVSCLLLFLFLGFLAPAVKSAGGSLCARGGYEVDIAWSHGRLVSATIFSRLGGITPARYGDGLITVRFQPGQRQRLRPENFRHNDQGSGAGWMR